MKTLLNLFSLSIILVMIQSNASAQNNSQLNTKLTVSSEDCNIVLRANQANAKYQWIDCGSGVEVEGATKRIFKPKKDGTYSVKITLDSLTDDSECITVKFEGTGNTTPAETWTNKTEVGLNIKISPTEQEDVMVVEIIGEREGSYHMEIFNASGKSMKKTAISKERNILHVAGYPKGDYTAKIISSKYGRTIIKFRVE